MKPINADVFAGFADQSGFADQLECMGFHAVWRVGACMNAQPVTILPGHLADDLRWRKMDEVPAHLTAGLYVVSRLGLCRLEESSFDEGAFNWIAGSGDYPVEDYEIYRPAIPGIDYVEGEV